MKIVCVVSRITKKKYGKTISEIIEMINFALPKLVLPEYQNQIAKIYIKVNNHSDDLGAFSEGGGLHIFDGIGEYHKNPSYANLLNYARRAIKEYNPFINDYKVVGHISVNLTRLKEAKNHELKHLIFHEITHYSQFMNRQLFTFFAPKSSTWGSEDICEPSNWAVYWNKDSKEEVIFHNHTQTDPLIAEERYLNFPWEIDAREKEDELAASWDSHKGEEK